MAQNNRNREHSTFRPEDEIDELFAGANPNPQRIGCAADAVLRAAGRAKMPLDHPVYTHLTECSDCYREFRGYQQTGARNQGSWRVFAAAAVLVIAVIGGSYAVNALRTGHSGVGASTITLDYRHESASRSESGDTVRVPKVLPRQKLSATILVPTGSEPGRYIVELVDGAGAVRLTQSGVGEMEAHAVRIKVDLELRAIPRGRYSLQVRRENEDWDSHPVIIR
jgi:hypothetical protein